jgi:serine/threonine protein kinase
MTMVGKVLEKYKILDKVGQGGMAVVYRGLDTTLGREVAVKVLHPHLAELEESRLRLQREAQAVAKLHHENILEIFAYSGLDSPESYIVTEYIHGKTLRDFLKDTPIPHPEVAAMIVREVCRALKHAHSFGVIHRDIKPENVMIRDDGMVKLTDFGIAQIVDKERMTVTGQLLGSPAYMAPEQVDGKPADFRSDVFSVGILLYQLATGDLPFRGKNPHEVLKRIADCKYVDPEVARPEVGARLARIIGRALCRDPGARHADIAAMLEELESYLAEADVTEPRVELQKFFADPKGYSAGFRPRLIAALTRHGEKALRDGRTPQALELFNRVLTVDPTNVRVTKSLARLSRRKLWRQLGWYGAAAVVLLGVAAAVVRAQPWRASARRPVAPVIVPVGVDAGPSLAVSTSDATLVSTPTVGPTVVAPGRLDAAPAVAAPSLLGPRPAPSPTKKMAPAAQQRAVELEIVPRVAAATVRLDGKAIAGYRHGQRVALGPGAHTITVSAPAFWEFRVPIATDDLRASIRVPLQWKPAQVVVDSEAPGAMVRVKRGAVSKDGLPGAALAMPVPPEADNGEFTVEVTVLAPGYRTASTTVTVRAGQTRTVTVPLRKAD